MDNKLPFLRCAAGKMKTNGRKSNTRDKTFDSRSNDYICALQMKKIPLGLVFIFFVGLVSCLDDPDCVTSTTDFANLKFYKTEDGEQDIVDIESVRIVGSDSVLLSDTTLSGRVLVPVDPLGNSITISFDTEFGLDTLVLTYQTSTRLVSEDCGIEILFTDLNYSRNDFDSISIVNNILIEEIDEDIRIFN